MTGQAQHPSSVLTLVSAYDLDTALAKLKTALVGLELRRTRLVLFGNPKAGTPVMVANPHAALELPLRLVAWEDDEGHTHVDYHDVAQTLGPLYGIPADLLAPLKRMPALLQDALA